MNLEFEKWHGALNDFILVYTHLAQREKMLAILQKAASALCNRDGSGIGADGILLLVKKNPQDLGAEELIIINADGSLAAHCGNGLRCAFASLAKQEKENGRGIDPSLSFSLQIGAKEHVGHLVKAWSHDSGYVRVDMGVAKFGSENNWHHDLLDWAKDAGLFDVTSVTLSNQHALIRVDKAVTKEGALAFCQSLQKGHSWDGINVHFFWDLELSDADLGRAEKIFGLRPEIAFAALSFERGVGFTQACGSGAAAIAVAALKVSEFGEKSVLIRMPGGDLIVHVEDFFESISLIGPASFVFFGTIEL